MIRPIVAYGDPVLKKEAEEVEQNHPDLSSLIDDMWETMYAADGVGLAAPQIGLSLRLFVADGSPFGEGEVRGSMSAWMVLARSLAEMPVVHPCPIRSTETVNGVS